MTRSSGRLGRIPKETLRWLASVDASQPAAKLFGLKQEAKTKGPYQAYYHKYLCHAAHTYGLSRTNVKEQLGISFNNE